MGRLLIPTTEEYLLLRRMRDGEHLYIENVENNPQTDPFTWRGYLSRNRDTPGTHLSGRELNSMRGGNWIVYDRESGECVLTHDGHEVLRLYRPSSTSNRVIKKKKGEYYP